MYLSYRNSRAAIGNMRRLIIIGALALVTVIVLVRIVYKRTLEKFSNGVGTGVASTLNTMTVCPTGTKMFMYNGAAYCCNGTGNPDADDIKQACIAPLFGGVFCALGPSKDGIMNCLELRSGQMQAEGERRCPPSKPNFCQADDGTAKCCAGLTNSAMTDCADSTPSGQCVSMPPGGNPLSSGNVATCDFLRIKELDAARCPQGYSQTIINGTGAFAGMTFCACTNMAQTCYTDDMLARLKKVGDVSGLTACSASSSQGTTAQ